VPEVPIDFVLFSLTLLGIALFHHRTFEVAIVGLVAITLSSSSSVSSDEGAGLPAPASASCSRVADVVRLVRRRRHHQRFSAGMVARSVAEERLACLLAYVIGFVVLLMFLGWQPTRNNG
jgi:hypothetical protein